MFPLFPLFPLFLHLTRVRVHAYAYKLFFWWEQWESGNRIVKRLGALSISLFPLLFPLCRCSHFVAYQKGNSSSFGSSPSSLKITMTHQIERPLTRFFCVDRFFLPSTLRIDTPIRTASANTSFGENPAFFNTSCHLLAISQQMFPSQRPKVSFVGVSVCAPSKL